eukprot:TRINITY_DN1482_c0_g3_i1.p1 TRINITY_DN1482_c0_g3~~TRINITY_DN1482_c0_g3_i1.p1  ORF type:complete len:495 (-),score=111.65 TRINITY_DN1482_c0_g3_i1:71-1555(-)
MPATKVAKVSVLDDIVSNVEVHLDGAAKFLSKRTGRKIGSREVILFAAIAFVLLPCDLVQLVFMTLGAVSYALFKAATPKVPKVRMQKHVDCSYFQAPRPTPKSSVLKAAVGTPKTPSPSPSATASPSLATAEWSKTQCPVKGYQFESTCWEAGVQELLRTLKPNAETEGTVRLLAEKVRTRLRSALPGLEVDGFASAQLDQCRAFGVAVPDVELVVRLPASGTTLDARPALRMITERLVDGKGEFKFRRSAFRSVEPKVTLLATAEAGVASRAVPLEVSINAVLPGFSKALLAECQRLDARSLELYCLVRQWSKERGVCYAPQGHMSPYLWCLLTVYYLQTGVEDEGGSLPKFLVEGSASLPSVRAVEAGSRDGARAARKKSVAELFKDFFHFYASVFDWSAGVVDVRATNAGKSVPLAATKRPLVHGVRIQDPLNSGHDLGTAVSELGGQRLREELNRAAAICREGQSLQELLQVWAPPTNEVFARCQRQKT